MITILHINAVGVRTAPLPPHPQEGLTMTHDLTEIREALANLIDLAEQHVPLTHNHPTNRAIVKRAKSALMLLTPATLLPTSSDKD